MAQPSPLYRPPATGDVWTGQKSLQFIEHLRRARLQDVGRNRPGGGPQAADQPQAMLSVNTQSASQVKIWEATTCRPAKFADEAASFYDYERVTLENAAAQALVASLFSPRFFARTFVLIFPLQAVDHGVSMLAIADPKILRPGVPRNLLGPEYRHQGGRVDDLAVALDQRLSMTADGRGVRSGFSVREDGHRKSARSCQRCARVSAATSPGKGHLAASSDIHIEPFVTGLVVRMRIDGMFVR